MNTVTFRKHPTNPDYGFATVTYEDGTEYEEVMSGALTDALMEERALVKKVAHILADYMIDDRSVYLPHTGLGFVLESLMAITADAREGE